MSGTGYDPGAKNRMTTPTVDDCIAAIEQRFRRSTSMDVTFYVDRGGSRVQIRFSRPFRGARRTERSESRDASFYGLTILEHKIATAVALGLSNERIGVVRSTAKRTIDRHVSTILGRLGFENRAQLASFIAAVEGWMIPFPATTVLEGILPVLGIIGRSAGAGDDSSGHRESRVPALTLGSLLPTDPERTADAQAMSRGEDLAVRGPASDRGVEERFPVRIVRHMVADEDVDSAVDAVVAEGIQGLMLGNFSIPAAVRILENDKLRGIPVVHSMVNSRVGVFAGPHPDYRHIFKMCADEFVYLRALSAYIREYAPDTNRVAVLIRDGAESEAARILASVGGPDEERNVVVMRMAERPDNYAELALELLHFAPEVIYLGVFVETDLVELITHIRRLLPDARLFCVWVPGIPGFVQRNPVISDGLVWSTLVGNSNNYFGVRFRAAFESEYRSDPGIGAAAVHFDMVNLLRRAWQDSGAEPRSDEIAYALSATRFTGVTGTFHFENGRRRTLCYPFDTDDPSIGQPCLTFEICQGRSIPLPLPGPVAAL